MVLAKLYMSVFVQVWIDASLTPIALKTERTSQDTSSEERSGTPAHRDPGSKVSSHGHGTDFGGVGGGEGLEDSPWEPADHVSDENHLDAGRKDEDEDWAN
jgi:hypothetical protein